MISIARQRLVLVAAVVFAVVRMNVQAQEVAAAATPTVAPAAASTNAAGKPLQQLQQLITKINGKITQGKRAEADYADELKEFDALIATQEKTKNDETAQIFWMRGLLHVQVFDDPTRGNDYFRKVMKDLPNTQLGRQASNMVANVERMVHLRAIQRELVVGKKFPDFSEVDVSGKPLSVGRFKGKVVLVDFWATWCGPCVMELPNVISTYNKYRDKGFEIVGISLDQDKTAMVNFTTARGMPWPQFFDGKLWENKLAQQYGIGSIPATFLLDAQGTIIARDLRGPELERAVSDALAKAK